MQPTEIKPLIIAEHASDRFGGEAVLPLHYFRELRKRGIDAHLIVHDRTKEELSAIDSEHIHYIKDSATVIWLFKLAKLLPDRLGAFTLGMAMRILTQYQAKKLAKELIKEQGFNLIHQPIPVSPKEPSLLYDMGVPVVIGPMNGGMDYPKGFGPKRSAASVVFESLRFISDIVHRLIPGKLKAQALLVANSRTARSLPSGTQGKIVNLVENGVVMDKWESDRPLETTTTDTTRFIFIGRLVDWKGVDYLLKAFALTLKTCNATLEIVGDGIERDRLQSLSEDLGLGDRVIFSGWLSQSECADRLANSDALVLPSVLECGGAVVLEAMASGKAVIATRWGGPCDYLDGTCGILVDPTTPDEFVDGLAEAIAALSRNPRMCRQMGACGYLKVKSEFNWERKIDRILDIYRETIDSYSATTATEAIDRTSEGDLVPVVETL